ncbi:MAG: SulP family inorganic anion transporter [Polyangiaceae bacterium]|nr:SulP family inorganic anion transporter [Polyangiaceae bacterium]
MSDDARARPGSAPAGLPEGPVSAAGVGIPPQPARGAASWLPGLWVARHYRRAWLGKDVVAGLVLSALLVPAGMGYATASGLPAVTGLYATIVPLVAYAVFGPSRIMVLGPDSALAALVAAAVVDLSGGDPERAVSLASLLAILTGLLCIGAGFARAGFLTDLLSKPVRVGYMNGIALTVLVGQLPKLLGFSVSAGGVVDGIGGAAAGIAAGSVKLEALAIGGASLGLILGMRAVAPKLPGVLFAVVLATAAVALLGYEERIAVVGPVPRGVPLPALPDVSLSDVGQLVVAAVGIALVSFADTSVLSRTYAGRAGYRVDPNRELIGLGIANLAGGFFRGFPVCSSSSRTPVAESAGSKTQLTGIVGALVIVILLVAAPGLIRHMPTAALAAVVIAAVLRLFDFRALAVFFRVRRSDFVLSLLAFLAVSALGVIPGIAAAVGVSLLDFVRRAWWPHDAVLGRAEGVKGYHDVTRYPDARQVPGLLLYRWDAPLFFANADTFRARILDNVDDARERVRWVVVAAEPITDVDTTAAEMIQELDTELAARGVELAFAELKDPVKDRLQRYGLKATIGHDFFFPTVGVAVKTYLEHNRVTWVDWEHGDGG